MPAFFRHRQAFDFEEFLEAVGDSEFLYQDEVYRPLILMADGVTDLISHQSDSGFYDMVSFKLARAE